MATLTSLVDRLRLELGDPPLPFQARVVADGQTNRFNLPVELVSDQGLIVSVEGAVLGSAQYEIDYRSGLLVLADTPGSGDSVVVEGSHFEAFLDEDLEMFVETAFDEHTHGRTNEIGLDLTMAELPGVEEYLVVILAQIQALWALVTDAAQEIDVRSPNGVNIPVGQRYQQLLGLIAALKVKYSELSQALNVGLHRIEMFDLRRVSRLTNRYVPVYKDMEYDQISKGFTPDHGLPGTEVTIKGENFTGVTAVLFGGVAAVEFEAVNDRLLRATVPEGAETGFITIVTPGGQIDTQYRFTVGYERPAVAFGAGAQRLYPPIDDGLLN